MSVELIRHAGWAEVVLNRPERRNAINGPLGKALAAAVTEADADDAVRMLLLRGSGGAFCSGLDLKEFNADPAPAWLNDFGAIWRGAHRALFNCSKPIVGALERYAINGGAALAIACDLLVAGEQAYLQVGEVQQGMAAPYNLAWLRLRHSEAVAAQVALVGKRLAGAELKRLGLAFEVVADAEVLPRAMALTEELAGYPPGAAARIKRGLRAFAAGQADVSADAWFDRATAASAPAVKPSRQVS
jgi:enoyl-CoA hydratase